MTATNAISGSTSLWDRMIRPFRTVSWVMIILLCLTLTGCSSCSDDDDDNSSDNTSSDDDNDDDDAASWTATQLLGIAANDLAYATATDSSGNVYVTGDTEGALNGETNAGERDVFIAKYNSAGTLQWLKLLGTASSEGATGIAVDTDSNVYITGYTRGALNGETNAGGNDAFAAKYNTSGTLQWVKLLGTASPDQATAIAVDSSENVYITGSTQGALNSGTNAGASDIFIAMYSSTGSLQWAYLLGTAGNEQGNGIAVDSSSNVYITGYSNGALNSQTATGGYDAFIAKYNTSGTLQWANLLGTTGNEQGNGITVDSSSNIYITGSTDGALNGSTNAGGYDIFTAEYNTSGTLQWLTLLGTASNEEGKAIALDSTGLVYVTGYTEGALNSQTNAGEQDAFIAKFSATGTLSTVTLVGTTSDDIGMGLAFDASGNGFVTGWSEGAFDGGTNAGEADGFVYKIE